MELSKISKQANRAISNVYQAFGGDFDYISLEDCQFIKKELTRLIDMTSDAISEKEKSRPIFRKGDDLKQFFFIGHTRKGCPIIEKRSIGMKGITSIEVSNVGKSFEADKHLTKVRVTGFKEDGKSEYQIYFRDVYIECTPALYFKYKNTVEDYMRKLNSQIKNLEKKYNLYADIIDDNLEVLEKKISRKIEA